MYNIVNSFGVVYYTSTHQIAHQLLSGNTWVFNMNLSNILLPRHRAVTRSTMHGLLNQWPVQQ